MIATAISTRFEFPESFRQYENDAFVPLLQKALEQVDLTKIIASLRTTDHTIELTRMLNEIKTKVEEVKFLNSYRQTERFITTDKALVVTTRKALQSAVFKFDGFLTDFKVAVETQLFLMKHTTAAEVNEFTTTLNAFSQKIGAQDILQAELAVDNLKALVQYFHSLRESSAMRTIRANLEVINNISPIISLGAKKYTAEVGEADISWHEAVAF